MPEEAPSAPLHKELIVVPQRMINGGFDSKFESDPYGIKLHGLLSATDYQDSITRLNDILKPYRSKKVDTALLVTGVLMVPLAAWAVRNQHRAKRRKKLRKEFITEFNRHHPELFLRWNRHQSTLTIERRNIELHGTPPPPLFLENTDVALTAYNSHRIIEHDDAGSSWHEKTPLVSNSTLGDEPRLLD